MKYANYLFCAVILSLSVGCKIQKSQYFIQDNFRFGSLNSLGKNNYQVVEMHGNDTLFVGQFAIDTSGIPSKLRVGYWKEYDVQGRIRMAGNYKLGSTINCGMGGAFREFYYYKIGDWKFYNDDGALKYVLNYVPTKLHVNSNCEDGDVAEYSILTEYWKMLYKQGLSANDIFALQKTILYDEMGNPAVTLVPINGELLFEIKL